MPRLSISNNADAPPPPPNGADVAAAQESFTVSCVGKVTKALLQEVQGTVEKLELIWNEVGFSEEERQRQLDHLLTSLVSALDTKVEAEEELRDVFVKDIEATQQKITRVCSKLGIVEEHVEAEGLGLSDQLIKFEEEATRVEQLQEERLEALSAKHENLLKLVDLLGAELEPEFADLSSNLRPERFDAIDRKTESLDEEVQQRKADVAKMVVECQGLMRELAIDSTESEIDSQIISTSTHAPASKLELVSAEASPSSVGVSMDAIERISSRMTELRGERDRRMSRLMALGDEISLLWERLQVPPEDQQRFRTATQGLSESTIEFGEQELKRLRVALAGSISELIAVRRGKIKELWERMEMGEEQQAMFTPMTTSEENFNEEMLQQHEEEQGRLEERLEKMLPLLKQIEKREEILVERAEMEAIQKDSSRLTARGRGASANLKREMGMQDRIKKLPKLTEKLREKLVEWEKEEGCFLWKGSSYIDLMDEVEGSWNQRKENEKAAKDEKRKSDRETALGNNNRASITKPARAGAPKKRSSVVKEGTIEIAGDDLEANTENVEISG